MVAKKKPVVFETDNGCTATASSLIGGRPIPTVAEEILTGLGLKATKKRLAVLNYHLSNARALSYSSGRRDAEEHAEEKYSAADRRKRMAELLTGSIDSLAHAVNAMTRLAEDR